MKDRCGEMELQKTKREISWGLYATAFVISAIIFGVGIWVGLQIENSATASLSNNVNSINQQWTNLETLIMLDSSPNFCNYFTEEMKSFDSETYSIGQQIGYMEEKTGVDPDLKSEYMSLEIRDYLTAEELNEKCAMNTPLVLYFVSSDNCPTCQSVGNELTAARQETGARVYTFDTAVNNSMVSSLASIFEITTYPTILINSLKYSGPLQANDIATAINDSVSNTTTANVSQ